MTLPVEWIVPDWPAPGRVRAFVTTRAGGVSRGDYASMNLGASSGDEEENVVRNRRIVRTHLAADPVYLAQVHGNGVADLDLPREAGRPRAISAARFGPDSAAIRPAGMPSASASTSLIRRSVPASSPLTNDSTSADAATNGRTEAATSRICTAS